MSSDDDIMDANLLSGDEDDQYVTGFDEEDDEELDMNEEGSNLDELDEEEDDEPKAAKPKLNGKSHSNKKQAAFDADGDEDELEDEQFGVNGKGDENILEKLKSARITHQKFFDMLSGKNKGQQEDDEDIQEDEGQEPRNYLVKIDEDLTAQPDAETVKALQKGKQDFLNLVNNLKGSVVEIKQKFLPILAHLKNQNLNIKEGMGYLDAKFNLMNLYCANLACYVLMKAQGASIKDHPMIRRLIYMKTLVTKLKPLDKKLEYQVNKLLRLANEEVLIGESYSKKAATEDPMALKPRPDAMSKTLTTENLDVTEEGNIVASKKQKQGIYVPPKFISSLMDEDAKTAKQTREEQRKKTRMLKNTFVTGLERDFGEAPEEVKYSHNPEQIEDKRDKERREYEETYMLRLPMTKQDKIRQKKQQKKAQQGEKLDDFTETDKIREYFKEQEKIKAMKDDEKDKLLKKTLADFITRRKQEKEEEGDGDMFNDFGDDEGAAHFGRRKMVKQDRGGFQNKKGPRSMSRDGPKKTIYNKFDKGNGPKKGGFAKGKKRF